MYIYICIWIYVYIYIYIYYVSCICTYIQCIGKAKAHCDRHGLCRVDWLVYWGIQILWYISGHTDCFGREHKLFAITREIEEQKEMGHPPPAFPCRFWRWRFLQDCQCFSKKQSEHLQSRSYKRGPHPTFLFLCIRKTIHTQISARSIQWSHPRTSWSCEITLQTHWKKSKPQT